MAKKKIKEICGNCLLYNAEKGECKVAVLIEGKEYHMPVFPQDKCHLQELNIPVQQVRWWCEDDKGNPAETGTVKVEYPAEFFGKQE